MDLQQTIKQVGLSENQAKVYLSALELGETSMTELAKKAVLKRPTTYLVVDELILLGLLSETKKGKRRIFSAVHPRRLLQIAKFREKQIEESLPELVAIYGEPKEKPKMQMFEGINGVRLMYQEIFQWLNKKEEILAFADIGNLRKYIPEALIEFKQLLRSLRDPKIRELNYGDEEGKKWSEETKKLRGKNHHVRILPTDFEFGASDNFIFGNKLVIFSLKKDIFVIIIESEDIAKTYRAMFEWVWKQGKEA